MSRDLNDPERFLQQHLAKLSARNPDPFDYGAAAGYFMDQLALAAAQVLGESAGPSVVMRWENLFYAKLKAVQAGQPQEVRLTPPAPPPPRFPDPEEHEAWIAANVQPAQVELELEALDDVGLTPAQLEAARWSADRVLRQADVARALGVKQWDISRFEFGELVPTREQFVLLRQFYKLPPTGFPAERMVPHKGKVRRLTKAERALRDYPNNKGTP